MLSSPAVPSHSPIEYDVAILGGSGANDITFIGTNPAGGAPTFGPSGSILIDPGFGADDQVDVFGNFPVKVANRGRRRRGDRIAGRCLPEGGSFAARPWPPSPRRPVPRTGGANHDRENARNSRKLVTVTRPSSTSIHRKN
jgi:hypothetical protein